MDFTAGLQVLRAPNEGGKSTLAESAAYALFGSKVLRTSLADTVTWGEKDSTLRVELDWRVDGNTYTFTRHKGGAEVTLDGKVLVTGQNEVRDFAAGLLGADPNMVNNLMFVTQGNLRGALEQGPKATAEMIETLANFDLFETLIERMQDQLTLGATAPYESKLVTAKARLEEFNAPDRPDVSGLEEQAAEEQKKADACAARILPLRNALGDLKAEAATALANQRTRNTLEGNLKRAQEALALHQAQRQAAIKKSQTVIDTARMKELAAAIQDNTALSQKIAAYAAVQKLMASYPEVVWEGTRESLEAEAASATTLIQTSHDELAQLRRELRDAEHALIHDKFCKACGQDVTHVFDIDKKNAEAQEKIDALQPKIAALLGQIQTATEDHADLQGVLRSSAPFDKGARDFDGLVDVDWGFVPPKLVWRGEAPPAEVPDVSELKAQLAHLESLQSDAQRAAVQAETLADQIEEDKVLVEQLTAQVAELPEPMDADKVAKQVQKVETEIVELEYLVREYEASARNLLQEAKAAKAAYEAGISEQARLQAEVEILDQELKALNFNNALLKKVRAARPIVSDKLWAMVLTAVSSMFTKMRGEHSIVTKGPQGFLVNGQAVASLSGSTLDLLGLAIRCALVKTFIPNATMLLLDEPAAASDDDRAASMLGFIQSAGFAQTVLITHEDISETLANNLITL